MSLSGIAGSLWIANGPLNFTPMSGFFALRYRVYQLRSTFNLMRFVSRPIFFASVAWLLGKVRKAFKSTGSSPLDFR